MMSLNRQRALIIGKPVSIESVSGITRPPLSPGGSGEGQSPTSFVRKKRAHRRLVFLFLYLYEQNL